MYQNIRATNRYGEGMPFDERLRIKGGFDLSGLSAQVNASDSLYGGSIYQNTRLTDRPFEIEAHLMRGNLSEAQMEDKRAQMYRVFNPNANPIRFEFETSTGQGYYFNVNLTAAPIMPPDGKSNNQAFQKVLLTMQATDPFIYAKETVITDIASWIGMLEFPLDIPEAGIEVEVRSPSLIVNVLNQGSDVIGMIIEFRANASLSNPKLVNVNTYEKFELDVVMLPGDVIRVNSIEDNYDVTLIRNNLAIDYFNEFTLDSTFLTLAPGDNLFRYDAASGIDNLEVRIIHRNTFVGV